MTRLRTCLTYRARLGFTLIEILVTIALVSILMSLAVPSMNAVRINSAVSETASDLSLAIQQAQLQALKVNRQVVVAPNSSSDWTSGWKVFIRQDSNSVYDDGVDTLIGRRDDFSSLVSVASTSNCANVTISSSGFLQLPGGGGFGDCRVVFGSSVTGRYKHVIVNQIGRSRVCTSSSSAISSCADS